MNLAAISTRSRFAAWLMVLAYALSLPGFTVTVVAAVAMFGSGHEIEVAFDHGHVDIVLHHDSAEMSHALSGGRPSESVRDCGPHAHDHVLHFAASSAKQAVTSPLTNVPPLPVAWVYLPVVAFVPARLGFEAMPRHAARPPPPMAMPGLRTTVLLV